MAIFNGYVSLPEGTSIFHDFPIESPVFGDNSTCQRELSAQASTSGKNTDPNRMVNYGFWMFMVDIT